MFLPNSDDLYRLIRVLYTEKYKYTTMNNLNKHKTIILIQFTRCEGDVSLYDDASFHCSFWTFFFLVFWESANGLI
jgi:hypothetical protein